MDSQNLDEEKWKLRVYLQAEDASFLVTYSPKHAKKRGESRVWFRSCYFTPSNDLVRKGSGAQASTADSETLQETSTGPGSGCRSLHAQPVEVWRSRLMKLSEGQSVIDSEADLHQKVPATALIDKDGV
ncbi:hypothetical protein CK203_096299 [Vitis vinifera]|uniref:Uncharacterized protein n=1 Tax=Vitis vinifera TaxID=29760 RepID=A0A438FC84_VITVI|nr:hypothetical protein CK203_096299 [Vitis vinifera]